MAELKCPHCGQAFTVDDTELSSIVQQIRDKEFEKDLNSRISELEKHMQEKHELELEVQESEIKLQVKIKHETTNYENLESKVERCPHCGSVHFVKNGFNPHHRQKYRCKDCRRVFMATTGTMFSHSRTTFDIWSVFIAGELNSLTLEQQSVQTGLTKTTCFNMRHRLYKAASRIQKDIILSGNIELDPSYVKINLKGTKPDNMPRASTAESTSRSIPVMNTV